MLSPKGSCLWRCVLEAPALFLAVSSSANIPGCRHRSQDIDGLTGTKIIVERDTTNMATATENARKVANKASVLAPKVGQERERGT